MQKVVDAIPRMLPYYNYTILSLGASLVGTASIEIKLVHLIERFSLID